MEQGQGWLNDGNAFVNIYSGKTLPNFTILLIMNYLTGSGRIPGCADVPASIMNTTRSLSEEVVHISGSFRAGCSRQSLLFELTCLSST